MRVIESCAQCLYEKQRKRADHPEYLREIADIIAHRSPEDTAPYLVHKFNQVYEKYFGEVPSYAIIKRQYNDLVLSKEAAIRQQIESSGNPFRTALLYARVGNYIDFGAMNRVDEETFLTLLQEAELQERDILPLEEFEAQCSKANRFLLLADNCGEIVLDKLFLEQLRKKYPDLEITVMVREKEVLNDATPEDAHYVGIDRVARIVTNGTSVAGTVYTMLPANARNIFDEAEVILSKGQGNYETLCNQGFHIFYSFLCKCELFTKRFAVPRLTGIFTEER